MISINIWVAVIAGSFALIGAVIGAALTRTNEHRQWLRNEKAEAYRHYLEKVALPSPQNFFNILGPDDQEEEPTAAKYLAFFADVYAAAMRVMLIAPGKIGEEVNTQLDRMTALAGWHADLPSTLSEKYYYEGQGAAERKAADDLLRDEAMQELTSKMHLFVEESVEHSNRVATDMRWDLKVADYLPWGRIKSLFRRSDPDQ